VTVDTPFTDIVVPLDGSAEAERALAPALELVRRTGVPLRVLTRSFPDEIDTEAAYLATVAERHAAEADIETVVVDRDSIPDAIVEGLRPGSLVCMSSRGRGGVARAVMGSIAEALLRTLGRPALVVGPHASRGSFAGRVVACIDGSPESERTLDPARAWATLTGQPLWLLEVAEPGRAPAEVGQPHVVEPAALAVLGRRAGADGWDLLHAKDPARALVDAAASPSAPTGLLVMASHGRTGWDRLHLGSVTVAVVHQAPVPVLVVPAGFGPD
jgi:nucleotide-binding universal stress UspA family protein